MICNKSRHFLIHLIELKRHKLFNFFGQMIYVIKVTYLQCLTMLNSPSVENPEHLSSFKASSSSNLDLAKTSRSKSLTIILLKCTDLSLRSDAAISLTQGVTNPPQFSGMRLNIAARGFPLSLSDLRFGKRRLRRSGVEV